MVSSLIDFIQNYVLTYVLEPRKTKDSIKQMLHKKNALKFGTEFNTIYFTAVD